VVEGDPVAPAEVSKEALRPAGSRLKSGWIWTGLVLALIGKILSMNRPERTPHLWILGFFLLPYAILSYWSYTSDTGQRGPLRSLRAALFAFLLIETFYWGLSIGGLAAAVGAYMIFTRFIRPRGPIPPASPPGVAD
jgi:hypothetical protein